MPNPLKRVKTESEKKGEEDREKEQYADWWKKVKRKRRFQDSICFYCKKMWKLKKRERENCHHV